MGNGPEITGILIKALAGALAARGLAPTGLLDRHGFTAAALADPDARFPAEQGVLLWESLARATGDENLGLHVAELLDRAVPFGAFEILDYAISASATLGQATTRNCEYTRLLADPFLQIDLRMSGDVALITSRIDGVPRDQMRHAVECYIATMLLRARKLTRQPLRPRAVHLRHARPADIAEHQRIFAAPLVFDAAADELIFDAAAMALPIPGADPALCAVLDRYARELLARMPAQERVTARVRTALHAALRDGDFRMTAVARKLAMSPRTLQRRLADEGSTFEDVLDTTRKELAVTYLADERFASSEVAFALGFSEPAAFHRAFKRWTGQTPGTWRKR